MEQHDGGFLSRWSQRKARAREGRPVPEAPLAAPEDRPAPPPAHAPTPTPISPVSPHDDKPLPAAAPPTLEDVALLSRDSDFARFVAPNVDGGVRNAALRKLFSDPRFNIMDGLDTYIDDYHAPDPLPPAMLRRMLQSEALGLFKTEAGPAPATTESQVPDEDPDLRLQSHDAAGPEGAEPGAGADPPGQS